MFLNCNEIVLLFQTIAGERNEGETQVRVYELLLKQVSVFAKICFHRQAAGCVILAICFLNTKLVQDIFLKKQYAPILNSKFSQIRLSHLIALSALLS